METDQSPAIHLENLPPQSLIDIIYELRREVQELKAARSSSDTPNKLDPTLAANTLESSEQTTSAGLDGNGFINVTRKRKKRQRRSPPPENNFLSDSSDSSEATSSDSDAEKHERAPPSSRNQTKGEVAKNQRSHS